MALAHSGYTRGSQGVAILARKNPPFWTDKTWLDPQGHYVGAQGTWGRTSIFILNVFAPPSLQQPVLDALGVILLKKEADTHIIRGEFNNVMDRVKDRSSLSLAPTRTLTRLAQFAHSLCLLGQTP